MTEKEELFLVDRIGDIMGGSEPEEVNDRKHDQGVSIYIQSPGNRIVNARDFIEININLGEGSHCEVREHGMSAIGDARDPGK